MTVTGVLSDMSEHEWKQDPTYLYLSYRNLKPSITLNVSNSSVHINIPTFQYTDVIVLLIINYRD